MSECFWWPDFLPARFDFDQKFYYFTLGYSSLLLFLLPFVGCQHAFDCSAYVAGGEVTVSSLIHREPLATVYAYLGALFLFCVVWCQSDHHISFGRFLLSFAAAKLLAVPLMVPLGSGGDTAHDVCVILGASFEVLVNLSIMSERNNVNKEAEGILVLLTLLMAFSVLVGSILAYNPWAGHAYAVLGFEYAFGIGLVSSAFLVHANKF